MVLGPLGLLLYPFTTLASLAILGGGIYFVWGWFDGALTGIAFLVAGLVMLLFSLIGRPIVTRLLASKRAAPDPSVAPAGRVHRLARPNGAELFVEETGPETGPALILTHGLGFDRTFWNSARQRLPENTRVFVWDQPGFGRSQAPTSGPYTIEMLADDLLAVVELAGDNPVILAGHSLGGMITLTFCRRHRDLLGSRVTGLVLGQTTFTDPVRTTLFHGLVTAIERPLLRPFCCFMVGLSPLFRLMNLQTYLSGMAHLGTHLLGFAGKETAAQLDFAAWFNVATRPASTGAALLAAFRYEASDILEKIPVPTLVITGDRDRVTLAQAGARIERSIPGAERIHIPRCGHLGAIEHSSAYSTALADWLARSAPAAAAVRRSA